MKFYLLNIVFVILLLIFTACDDNNPTPENPEELITTLRLHFDETGTSNSFRFEFQDLDGDGGNDPTVSAPPMKANTTYTMYVEILNESVSPEVDITEEVREESSDHQLFYSPSASMNYTNMYDDADTDGNPIGLENVVSTGDESTGTLTVVLRHNPDKNANGVADGDITHAGGSTDVEVVFEVRIE